MLDRLKTIIQNRWAWAVGVFAFLLVAYERTLLPSTVGGDAGELQYAGPILALTHPTGLPLYVLLGHVWAEVVTIGSVAYRMNLLSAVSGALACAVLVLMVHRLYNNVLVAVAAALSCGLAATYWGQAVLPDKYAFNAIWVVAVVGLALRWAQQHEQPQANRLLYTLSAVYGISLLHHRTMLLFAFGLGVLVLWHERAAVWQNWRRTLICLALVLGPALVMYPTFLPWIQARELAPSEWQPQTLSQWIEWLMDRDEAVEAFVTEGVDQQLVRYIAIMQDDYTVVVIVVAAIGALGLVRKDPGAAFFVLFTFVLQGGLAANWRDNDRPYTYYLPSFLLLIYAYAHGLALLWNLDSQPWRQQRWAAWGGRAVLGVLVLVVVGAQWNYAFDKRHENATYGLPLGLWRTTLKSADMGDRLASGLDDLPPEAVVLTEWEPATILWYYHKVENVRPDLTIRYPVARYLPIYEDSGRPLCVSHHVVLEEVTQRTYHPTAVDALICLQDVPQRIDSADDLPSRVVPIQKMLHNEDGAPQLELMGFWMRNSVFKPSTYQPLVLSWRAASDLETDYSISLRIYRDDWTEVWRQDLRHPVSGMHPTSRWVENELVHDYHELPIPPNMQPGNYFWAVVVYSRDSTGRFANLRHPDDGEVIFGSTFQVE